MSFFSEFYSNLLTFGLERFGLYYGTYRGQVLSVDDPQNRGRIRVVCPHIHGRKNISFWAEPMAPMAGQGAGFWWLPEEKDWVYVEFDHGRPEAPFWKAGWWAKGELHPDMTAKNILIITKEGLRLRINREEGTIAILDVDENSVEIAGDQITIQHGTKVQVIAPAVTITSQNITLDGPTEII